MTQGPLNGLRILDLTHVWAGPLAVRILADLGAQVVKVEAPYGRGPRTFPDQPIGGFLGGEPGQEPWNRNAVFVKLMRNRRSVCLDLKQPQGRATLLALVAEADALIENFSARAMPSLGLDDATLQAANPRLIHIAMPGFGSSGPYAERVAFGPTVEPLSGLTQVLGYGPTEPRCTSLAVMDPIAALAAASALVAAVRRRTETGCGTRIELTLHESGVGYSGPWLIDHQLGHAIGPRGNRHPALAPQGVYPCRDPDTWLAISCPSDAIWARLVQVIPGLDATLTLAQRQAAHDHLDARISDWTRTRGKRAAERALLAAGVPAGAVLTAPELLADPQSVARGFFVPLEDRTPVPGNPVHMPGVSSADWRPCPRLGADNAAVLRDWLGWDDTAIDALAAAGVSHDRPPTEGPST
ncbi:MAG: CaiB/BaiF CoA transferase family protein [Gammaproteobacteria bacterium]